MPRHAFRVFTAALILGFMGIPLAYAKGRALLYVVHSIPQKVHIYDPESSKTVGTIPVGESPFNMAVSPDGRWLAVGHKGSSGKIWIIEIKTKKVIRKIDIWLGRYRESGDNYLLFSMDGKKLYSVDPLTRYLDVVRTSDWEHIKKLPLGLYPRSPILSPNGSRLYIVQATGVLIIDTKRDEAVDSLKIEGQASAAAISRDEKTLYITDMENNRVLFLDIARRAVIKEIPVGIEPRNLLIDDRFLYILNTHSNNLSIVDIRTMENIKTIPIGILPERMVLDPVRKRLFVALPNEAGIAVMDVVTQKQVMSIAAEVKPAGVVLAP